MQRPIGFSTGCLYRLGRDLGKLTEVIQQTRADAIELNLSGGQLRGPEPLANLELEGFSFVAAHARPIDFDQSAREEIRLMEQLCADLPVASVVVHPDVVSDVKLLADAQVPLALENMDARKTRMHFPAEFRPFVEEYDMRFVLDVQHAYEHDPSMELAHKLFELMGDRLSHLHVSGQSAASNHELVCRSDNKQAILSFLRAINVQVPLILEGVVPGQQVFSSMSEELDLIRSVV